MSDGEVQELGDFELDGVAFPAAEVQLEFLDPADDEGGEGGPMFPTGNHIDVLDVPGVGKVEATLINAGNPTVFVDAARLGLKGTELQGDINGDKALLARVEQVRALGAVAMGVAATPEEATTKRQHTPKLAFVAKPAGYTASDGRAVEAGSIDLLARIFSMGVLHHAMTGTGAVAIAAAAAIPGTLVHRVAPVGARRPRALRPSLRHAEGRRRGREGRQSLGGEEGDDEPFRASAHGGLGAGATRVIRP